MSLTASNAIYMLVSPHFRIPAWTSFLKSRHVCTIANLIATLGYGMNIKFNIIRTELLIFPQIYPFQNLPYQHPSSCSKPKTWKLCLMPLFTSHLQLKILLALPSKIPRIWSLLTTSIAIIPVGHHYCNSLFTGISASPVNLLQSRLPVVLQVNAKVLTIPSKVSLAFIHLYFLPC